jgi:hypothetical protein
MKRVVLPNYPHHGVQRGHNRQVVFAEDEDFQRYLSDLYELATNKSVPFCPFVLLSFVSFVFTFAIFGNEPMDWNFSVKTHSDAFMVGYSIEST